MSRNNSRLSNGVFQKLTVNEFHELLGSVKPQRTIDAVHLHHTWKPRHADFNGVNTIVGMWRYHTQQQRWSDIAQHLTIDPDGALWTGRHWDLPPASAKGHNGSARSGPFMIEMIGDFDAGADGFAAPQREAALTVLALLVDRFELPTSAIKFHNQMSGKTCPGTTIDRAAILGSVDGLRGTFRPAAPRSADSPFSSSDVDDALFKALAFLRRDQTNSSDPRSSDLLVSETFDAEIAECGQTDGRTQSHVAESALESAAHEGRDVDVALTASVKNSLKPYVVNLRRGKFSTEGEFTTSKEDVDEIFDAHLPRAIAESGAQPLRIVFYAHGGLVGEKDGLGVALKHVDWWRGNGIYPIYFVWETDLLSSIINAVMAKLGGGRERALDVPDIFDAQIEAAARRAKANSIWADMKHVAELASQPEGGARYVAARLGQFCRTHGAAVEVHAVGHSAGSNFHSFFIPACLDAGVPVIETLQFLAPAITVDGFFATIAPRLSKVGPVTMFTMKDSFEQDDDCRRVYTKSLLYLIHHALEDKRDTDLLGLEISVRRDLRLRRLFGLEGGSHPRGHEIVWSKATGDRRSASESVSHGGFDDDPSTMNSVLRRVLKLTGLDEVPMEFVKPARSADVEAWERGADLAPQSIATCASAPLRLFGQAGKATNPDVLGARGARRALCVGINSYKRKPLQGCVADSERWAATLKDLGFALEPMIVESAATADRILSALGDLVRRSQSGDVVAFQFAGHGTTLPDGSGDEAGGDSPGRDEALCPYDFTEGRFIVDDELANVFDEAARRGVRVTSFIDCCHSGSITRLGIGAAVDDAAGPADERARFVEPTAREITLHLERMRAARIGARGKPGARGPQRDVLFSACMSMEVAWESGQQGDFTRHATEILRESAPATNGALLERIQAAFGPRPRQHPELHPPSAAAEMLFGRSGISDVLSGGPREPVAAGVAPADSGEVAALLRAIADVIVR
jgi:hypothetical protein